VDLENSAVVCVKRRKGAAAERGAKTTQRRRELALETGFGEKSQLFKEQIRRLQLFAGILLLMRMKISFFPL
jgi:hypothetical protein